MLVDRDRQRLHLSCWAVCFCVSLVLSHQIWVWFVGAYCSGIWPTTRFEHRRHIIGGFSSGGSLNAWAIVSGVRVPQAFHEGTEHADAVVGFELGEELARDAHVASKVCPAAPATGLLASCCWHHSGRLGVCCASEKIQDVMLLGSRTILKEGGICVGKSDISKKVRAGAGRCVSRDKESATLMCRPRTC